MTDTIICPNCATEIEVTEALSSQLREQLKKHFDAELRKKEQDFASRDEQLRSREGAIEEAKKSLDEEVSRRLEPERQKLIQEAARKAKEELAVDLKDKDEELVETRGKLAEAQQAELDLRKSKRVLEDQKRELELTVERRIGEERGQIREQAKKEAADERALKDAEKDKLIGDLTQQIDELKRKSEQGSQQLQGEVLELELEDVLRRQFPFDTIVPVPKGVHGGDLLQIVHDSTGAECGTILWESKRTRNWSDAWLPKLRDDQREAKAQFAVLASIEMPKGLATFSCIDGIWVTSRACIIGVATALRAGLIEVANAKRSVDGRNDKMELLYNYLSGTGFRHRVEGIVEAFATLRTDLEAEKRSTQRMWAKREKQLDRALSCTSGMYGDLQGIIGASLPAIESLDVPLLDGPDPKAGESSSSDPPADD